MSEIGCAMDMSEITPITRVLDKHIHPRAYIL